VIDANDSAVVAICSSRVIGCLQLDEPVKMSSATPDIEQSACHAGCASHFAGDDVAEYATCENSEQLRMSPPHVIAD
jgi:hypothetical protein